MAAKSAYEALCDIRGGINPNVVGAYLEQARAGATDEVPETAVYVELARPEDSPIHKTLEWDDFKLAEAARREQAGVYFRCVIRQGATRAEGVSLRMNGTHKHYSADEAMSSDDLRRLAAEAVLKRVLADTVNHAYLPELAPVRRAAERALHALSVGAVKAA